MITVKEALTRRQQKEFLDFPNRLYKGNDCYVPPLYLDEKKIFKKNYLYYDTCDAVYFNAYDESGKMVGRISGILQKASNEKRNEKRVRFIRFDSIDSQEVADALFGAVEKWALEKGMDTVCGPLGFSDLEREGLLVDGFDCLSTFEEQYNAPYYEKLIKNLGFEMEAEWNESRIRAPKDEESVAEMKKMSAFIMRRYGLHLAKCDTVNEFLDKYANGFFEILDKSYEQIYGTVPFTDGMKKLMIDNFRLIIDLNHVAAILDKDDKVVCLGICFPSIAKAMQAGGGHLTPKAICRFLKAKKHPEYIDLGLIGVDPVYLNRGVGICVADLLVDMLKDPGVKWAETNLNLVDNYAIQNLWTRFDREIHKVRRAYVKKIGQ